MATISKTWAFPSDVQSWVATKGANTTAIWQSADGNPSNGCLELSLTGKNNSDTPHWDLTGTWEALFGIPAGSTVSQINSGDGYDWKCATFTTGGAGNLTGPFELRDSGGALIGTISASTGFSGTTAWTANSPANSTVAVTAANQPSATTVSLRLNATLKTGNSVSAVVTLRHDSITVTITYEPPIAPQVLPTVAIAQPRSATVAYTTLGSSAALIDLTDLVELRSVMQTLNNPPYMRKMLTPSDITQVVAILPTQLGPGCCSGCA